MMKITEKQIKELNPCSEGWNWYLKNKEKDLEKLLLKSNKIDSSWSRWLFTNLMTKEQNAEIVIFSAKEVLPIYEEKYPNDDRPRKAIEAAQKYLDDPTEKNANAANAASYAAAVAASANAANAASYAANAAAAAAYAAYAAYAADAADAASYAAYATDAAAYAAYAKLKLQENIIKRAVEILEAK